MTAGIGGVGFYGVVNVIFDIWQLGFVSPAILDYVVIHDLCYI